MKYLWAKEMNNEPQFGKKAKLKYKVPMSQYVIDEDGRLMRYECTDEGIKYLHCGMVFISSWGDPKDLVARNTAKTDNSIIIGASQSRIHEQDDVGRILIKGESHLQNIELDSVEITKITPNPIRLEEVNKEPKKNRTRLERSNPGRKPSKY